MHCLETDNSVIAVENSMIVSQKLKDRINIRSSTSEYIPRKIESRVSMGYLYIHVHDSITDNSHDIDITRTPTDRRADKQDVAMKKNEIMPYAATRMDAETSIRSEIVRTRETNTT